MSNQKIIINDVTSPTRYYGYVVLDDGETFSGDRLCQWVGFPIGGQTEFDDANDLLNV